MALPKFLESRFRLIASIGLLLGCCLAAGCQDDSSLVRQIQTKRQAAQQSQSQQDHLGEVFALLRQYIELEPEKAQRQMAYHLNRWSGSRPDTNAVTPDLVKTIRDFLPPKELADRTENRTFQTSDAIHLRDSFLLHAISSWADRESSDEQLLTEWLKTKEAELPETESLRLRKATRLFDWTIRNIALEPAQPLSAAPPGPAFPFGMQYRGAGYRQTLFQTINRGVGDGLQRADVFTGLCRQAGIPSAILAAIDGKSGELTPFCVGVLIDDEIYLFEPTLGIFVPGPGQVGIATLAQARADELVLRRLSIAGLDEFKYPITKSDVQQCAALLNLAPEAISPRMAQLQSGLTGDRRMSVYVDAAATAEAFDAVTGISSVRLWDVPVLSEIYQAVCELHGQRDPVFQYWFKSRWAMLEAEYDQAEFLARGRWQHLLGQFSDSEDETVEGARTLYLAQRKPEFEIDDLRIDVDLQKQYGIRRPLGTESQLYDQQVAQIQVMIRLGKRTATYWLSLLQADDGREKTAENWLSKRVLMDEQMSYWFPSARYNLARLMESSGKAKEAVEMYKREGEPQEHGNRIRARLLEKQTRDEES